ncbi:MAG TPA: EamA family transporter [Gemmatimonadaceae bacterium]|nr:EamA family transporter [Gemmatimonadaceae bacterium]
MTPATVAKRNRTRVLLAFAAVYVVWGSTYLFIKYAIETMPPFMMGAARFLVAGAMLYALARFRGAPRATARDWRSAAITGILMLGVGNGAVVWSELTVPSGVVALIVSTVPIWVVLIDWLRPRGVRPKLSTFVGLALGLIGMVILIGPKAIIGQGHVNELGALALTIGSLSWAIGTVLSKGSKRSGSPLVYSGLQMLSASGAMALMSIVAGEPGRFSLSDVSLQSALSLVYLILFGSIIGYTAYIYLLNVVSAAKASTYAYVNPVIAVVLGWAFASEPIGVRTLVAATVILAGVAIITMRHSSSEPASGARPAPTNPGNGHGGVKRAA